MFRLRGTVPSSTRASVAPLFIPAVVAPSFKMAAVAPSFKMAVVVPSFKMAVVAPSFKMARVKPTPKTQISCRLRPLVGTSIHQFKTWLPTTESEEEFSPFTNSFIVIDRARLFNKFNPQKMCNINHLEKDHVYIISKR